MAKANLVLPDGTKVDIDGTADEVATLLARFAAPAAAAAARPAQTEARAGDSSRVRGPRKGQRTLIIELVDNGFFKQKRSLADVQRKLEESGHIFAQQSLSTPMLRLTRDKTLRRIKEKDGWVYVA